MTTGVQVLNAKKIVPLKNMFAIAMFKGCVAAILHYYSVASAGDAAGDNVTVTSLPDEICKFSGR